jgi:hypothetical protein
VFSLRSGTPSSKASNPAGSKAKAVNVSVYKRQDSEYYWFKFSFGGKLYQRPAKVRNRREAERIEAAFRTMLANGEVGIEDQKPVPTLREFSQSFIDFVQTRHANKPETVKFYASRLKRLLGWEKLRETRLNLIDEALIERYILHIASEWKIIKGTPKVRLLSDVSRFRPRPQD